MPHSSVATPSLEQLRGTESVLAVDDNAELRALIFEQMTSLGYRVTQAASGDEALAILEDCAGRFDLLLSDVVMPGRLCGVSLATLARARWPQLRVLLVSGFAATAALESGPLAFPLLQKPFRKKELALSVRLALASGIA